MPLTMHGLVPVEKGEIEAGIRQSEAALETLKSVPSRRFHLPIRIGIVGLAKAGGGDRDGALALFDSGLRRPQPLVNGGTSPNCFASRPTCWLPDPNNDPMRPNIASRRRSLLRSSKSKVLGAKSIDLAIQTLGRSGAQHRGSRPANAGR
jgi:hypothetical protein